MARGSVDRLRAWVPRWWRGEGGAAGRALDALLYPAEQLYGATVRARNLAYDASRLRSEAAPIPVVSVGNIGVGGAGKTPFAAWVAGRLREWGVRPAVVLRGYGADEVLVHWELNPEVPVLAARQRIDAARRAAAQGCGAVVLDDAFQHRALRRDLDLVLVSADGWTGRRRLLPRGPWREGLAALRRADAVIVTRKAVPVGVAERVAAELRSAVPGLALAHCRIAPARLLPLRGGGEEVGREWLRDRPVLAVASLADPLPFARNLEEAGARVELAAFPDHHEFSPEDEARIRDRAGARPLVMTRKEAVKLRSLLSPGTPAYVLDQRVEIERGAEELDRLLRGAVRA